jgi:superfamily II DNA or RNA helicase
MGSRQREPGVRLRRWQREALEKYAALQPRDFLASATPGAGKTTFALTLADRLRAAKMIDRIVVVAPTDHLRTQWAVAAEAAGIRLDPTLRNSIAAVPDHVDGYVTTYAQVAMSPLIHRRRVELKRTFVILDEVHHAGDGLSWGDGVSEAFTPATRRLCLTGTPFRTRPEEQIPFVSYAIENDEILCQPDYLYSYAEALADRVVRPVVFAAYSGVSRWKDSAGQVLSASLSEGASKRTEDAAWRTALNPKGKWIPHVIAAADARLTDLRDSGMPDAGALMLATDQAAAKEYAKIIQQVTGHKPVVAVSEDPQSSRKIARFATGTERWIVAVRQVSEGVDITRLACLLYATSYRTPLFFAQAVGRVVRARGPHESATVFLPAVRPLLEHAAAMEQERAQGVRLRNQALADPNALDPLDAGEREAGSPTIEALDAEAEFAHILASGRAITNYEHLDPDDANYLGLPGLLTPEQTASLLAARDAELRKRNASVLAAGSGESSSWQVISELRREVHSLVGQYAARTKSPHSGIHLAVRQAVPGPPSSIADRDVLEQRRDWLLAKLAR